MYEPKFPNLYSDNRLRLIELLREGKAPVEIIDDVLGLVDDTDYFEAPASTKHHGAEPGGLFAHSENVTELLVSWSRMGLIVWEHSWSPYVVGLLHDFTKVGKYRLTLSLDGLQYTDRAPAGYGGHGSDSLCKVAIKVPLSEEESMCIRFHMGAYEKDDWKGFDEAIQKYPNVLWTHHADMVASKLVEV